MPTLWSLSPGALLPRSRRVLPLVRALAAATAALVATAAEAKPSKETTACIDAFERSQEHRQAQQLVAAKADLEVCAADKCPVSLARQCKPWLAEVSAALPTVVVRAKDERGAEVSAATLIVDDLPAVPLPREAWPLDPGAHRLTVRLPGGEEARANIVLIAGEKQREVVVAFAPSAPPPVVVPPAAPGLPPRRGLSAGPLALFATSAVGAGLFVTFGSLARSERDDLRTRCSPACSDAEVGRVRTKSITADVALGVSVVTLGLGLYAALSRVPAAAPTATRVRPTFDVARDHAGASVALTF